MTKQQQQLKTAINLIRFRTIDTDGNIITKRSVQAVSKILGISTPVVLTVL